ncbi:hypothetical protein WME99_25680 [Sorangium sp. So ce136]|uniref:hypothetical protein n=1 Tax=Sorangium sp. So ce136 TaxID=3133284 RepID=UPI003F07154E
MRDSKTTTPSGGPAATAGHRGTAAEAVEALQEAPVGDGCQSCMGGRGGHGGPGGDSIGIAYLDEDRLMREGVIFDIEPPGTGGMSWNHDGTTTMGPSGDAHETLRFPE